MFSNISPAADDMLVTKDIFPLAAAVDCTQRELAGNGTERDKFT